MGCIVKRALEDGDLGEDLDATVRPDLPGVHIAQSLPERQDDSVGHDDTGTNTIADAPMANQYLEPGVGAPAVAEAMSLLLEQQQADVGRSRVGPASDQVDAADPAAVGVYAEDELVFVRLAARPCSERAPGVSRSHWQARNRARIRIRRCAFKNALQLGHLAVAATQPQQS
jgi:hypothetical protein